MMRLRFIGAVFVVIFLVLIGRIYYLSVQKGTFYEYLAQRNTIKTEALLPVRGTIYDRNGHPLAVNRLGFSISITAHLSHTKVTKKLDEILEFILSINPDLEDFEILKERYKKSDSFYSHDPVEIIPFVSYENILPFFTKLEQNRDVIIAPTTLRHYPTGKVTSHILGYVSKTDRKNKSIDPVSQTIGFYGRAGVERFYNSALQGELGKRTYKVSAYNKEIEEIERIEPSQHQDMVLHLDIRLQQFVHELFENEGRSGVVAVMDLETGGLITAVSYPEFDNNKFVTGISSAEWKEMIEDFNHPFINKMVNSLYPPGSVVKPSVALAFMESGQMNPSTEFYCSGASSFGGRDFRCWKKGGHGDVNLRKAIRESCDVYFYRGGHLVGIDAIANKLLSHGYGSRTGVDLPNEFMGTVPTPEWKMGRYNKPWFTGETLITAIGQGAFLSTPLQVLTNTALIATGELIEPRVVMSVRNEEVAASKREALSASDKYHIDAIRQAMIDVTTANHGTARWAFVRSPVEVAGKTGTAQVISIPQEEKERMSETELEYRMRSHAWFTGFAPAKEPKYAFVVLLEHGMSGGGIAAPFSAKIINKMNNLGYFAN